jgi:hypothetical protein
MPHTTDHSQVIPAQGSLFERMPWELGQRIRRFSMLVRDTIAQEMGCCNTNFFLEVFVYLSSDLVA